MKTAGIFVVSLALGMFLVTAAIGQDVPQLINYQGKLIKDGKPVNGEVGITFVIYDDSTADAQELWSEYQTVPVTGGHYNVLLGIVNHFEDGDSVFLGDERYLGIKVGNDPEMRPRMRIASVGFALNADKVDGEDASHFLPAEDLDHLDAADGNPANAVYVDSAGNVFLWAGNVQISRNKLIGRSLEDDFTYDGQALGHYSLGWFDDSWTGSGPTAWFSSYGGFKFFTRGKPRLAITVGGNVGIGTTNPSYALDVVGDISCTGNYHGSDLRWKKDIKGISNSLERVISLRGVSFEWKKEEYPDRNFSEGRRFGLVAQEVKEVFPEVVSEDKEGYYYIAYNNLVPVLIEATKEQQEIIKQQSSAIDKLRLQVRELQAIKSELEDLRASVARLGLTDAETPTAKGSK